MTLEAITPDEEKDTNDKTLPPKPPKGITPEDVARVSEIIRSVGAGDPDEFDYIPWDDGIFRRH